MAGRKRSLPVATRNDERPDAHCLRQIGAFDARPLRLNARSVRRAAEALGLTLSEVGRAAQRLEARVGVRLLDRTTRSLRLSDDRARFYERVRPMLDLPPANWTILS